MLNHSFSRASWMVVDSLSGMTIAACHLVQRSSMWKMMLFLMNKRSHSTWLLKVSAISVEQILSGPGLDHCLQTRQVCTISGMSSNT